MKLLKFEPCPMCGHIDILYKDAGNHVSEVRCKHCGFGIVSGPFRFSARLTWNRYSRKKRKNKKFHLKGREW